MRPITNPMAAVEALQMYSSYAQVADRLGLPSQAYMGLSDSKFNDPQAGAESGIGIDMAKAADAARRYRSVSGLPIMAQPNAGQPVLENLQVVYRQSPQKMAAGLDDLLAARARIVGGCCGSTPEHIRLSRQLLDHSAAARPRVE